MITITLPWPPSELNKNDTNTHRMAKARIIKEAREVAYYETLSHRFGDDWYLWEKINATYTFHPPDRRRRDLMNWLGACAAFQDGMFDALDADDYREYKQSAEYRIDYFWLIPKDYQYKCCYGHTRNNPSNRQAHFLSSSTGPR